MPGLLRHRSADLGVRPAGRGAALAAVRAAATEAGFASVHAVPMRAAGIVLGALACSAPGSANSTTPICWSAQTLAHIACVAILQEQPPTPATVLPRLRTALTSRVVVEQAKGFLRERLDVSMEEAFDLLRRYARNHGDHLTEVSRRLITQPETRPAILAACRRSPARPPS